MNQHVKNHFSLQTWILIQIKVNSYCSSHFKSNKFHMWWVKFGPVEYVLFPFFVGTHQASLFSHVMHSPHVSTNFKAGIVLSENTHNGISYAALNIHASTTNTWTFKLPKMFYSMLFYEHNKFESFLFYFFQLTFIRLSIVFLVKIYRKPLSN